MNVVGVGSEPTGEVALLVEELSRAVELTLIPTVSHEERSQAYNACESFKENSPWCAQAGLLLASGNQHSPGVKHFGLQLMEHTVKYRWTQITQAEKIFIKENAMKLLYLGGWDTSHLNDALARVIVEMIKREWPQQWPTLLAELSDACSRGHRHTQIVLHVFLRLAEDVAILQVVLLTLTGYVEWVSINHVVMNNGRLLQILCILLQDDVFQLPAAECLLQIVNRKGSVLAGLAQQLTSLWSYATDAESWLPVILETMLLLTSHPSLTLAHTANSVWLAFLKHEQISKLPYVLAVVPRWLQASAPKVLKVSYPSSRVNNANDAVTYARMDYDSEQEFAIFFSRCRTEILESFKFCMTAAPLVTWGYVEQWTRAALDKVDTCPQQMDTHHPMYIEWEALSQYPLLLLPVFGRLHELCRAALARPDLSAVESVTLQEALLLVSNHFCCYERQSALVAQVLGDCSERWASLSPHLSSAEGLTRLIGLDAPPTEDEDDLGAAAGTLGRELYAVPGLANFLVDSLFFGLEYLPDHWLRPIVRNALKPLLHHCPPAHYADVALPLLEHFAPFMLTHLSVRWDYISSLYESGKLEEEGGSESQEVLEDILVRNLTREHLEVLKISLVDGGLSIESSVDEMEDDTTTGSGGAQQRAPDHVSELGALVLAQPCAGPATLYTVIRALTWNDSPSSLRGTALALPALRGALAAGRVGAAEANGALTATYEILRPLFPGIVAVLRAIPDVDAHDLHRLDEKLNSHNTKPSKIDKSKRDLFKKITSRLIGRNVGQLFKKEVYILDLPTMHIVKDKPRSAIDTPEGAGLERLFAPSAPT
ncbi:hypothetical protein HF086_002244 [Spodoptera exigua]|uniref:Importin N-terminal domain-containing protein n=1 Tax=Spodoptera exigua TaxID=7107 RepID=A0A922MSI7_SPOEX|nr:hypothetical protein HF086_002244 [Spodoptera exigua]